MRVFSFLEHTVRKEKIELAILVIKMIIAIIKLIEVVSPLIKHFL